MSDSNQKAKEVSMDIEMVFVGSGDFEATNKAEQWCAEQGVSIGSMQRGAPRGLMRGDFVIAKWRNLSDAEIAALDGRMIGDGRNGPIHLRISRKP
jgi:hypothetical protein